MALNPYEHDVSIKLTHSLDEDGECEAFTNVDADIFISKKKVGSINAILVDRQRIPERQFYSLMDGHSADLQWIGVTLFEPRLGRTKLQSLVDHDEFAFPFLYIRSLTVDQEYLGCSDVGAAAVRKFLHHPFLSRKSGRGAIAAIYILETVASMTAAEQAQYHTFRNSIQAIRVQSGAELTEQQEQETKRWAERGDAAARRDANQFLRNGFFLDPALANQGTTTMLVATFHHWRQPMLSHAQADAMVLPKAPEKAPDPTGKDAELLQLIKKRKANPETIQALLNEGATIVGSHALHAACANNAVAVVSFLLTCPTVQINAIDQFGFTPLMVAAETAPGRGTRYGLDDVQVMDQLLAAGASKVMTDSKGMTAYGLFKKRYIDSEIALNAMCGTPYDENASPHPTILAVYAKLVPSGGPTAADLAGGEGEDEGFVNYKEEDEEADAGQGRMTCYDYDSDDY